jgi:hypothetical protein
MSRSLARQLSSCATHVRENPQIPCRGHFARAARRLAIFDDDNAVHVHATAVST